MFEFPQLILKLPLVMFQGDLGTGAALPAVAAAVATVTGEGTAALTAEEN